MRRAILLFVLALFALTVPLRGQPPQRASWDYLDAEITNVTHFEVKVDAAPAYTEIGIPTPETLSWTAPANHSYTWTLPPLGSGQHTFAVRACNSAGCSFDTSVVFRHLGPPTNLRIVR